MARSVWKKNLFLHAFLLKIFQFFLAKNLLCKLSKMFGFNVLFGKRNIANRCLRITNSVSAAATEFTEWYFSIRSLLEKRKSLLQIMLRSIEQTLHMTYTFLVLAHDENKEKYIWLQHVVLFTVNQLSSFCYCSLCENKEFYFYYYFMSLMNLSFSFSLSLDSFFNHYLHWTFCFCFEITIHFFHIFADFVMQKRLVYDC